VFSCGRARHSPSRVRMPVAVPRAAEHPGAYLRVGQTALPRQANARLPVAAQRQSNATRLSALVVLTRSLIVTRGYEITDSQNGSPNALGTRKHIDRVRSLRMNPWNDHPHIVRWRPPSSTATHRIADAFMSMVVRLMLADAVSRLRSCSTRIRIGSCWSCGIRGMHAPPAPYSTATRHR
jgi:hypothetical protein